MKEDGMKKILCLLSDADHLLLKVIKNKFTKDAGWESIITTRFDDALREVHNNNPDVLITDIILADHQGRTGYDLIQMIKGQRKKIGCEIMVFTELKLPEDKEKARALGVKHYFVKSEITINQLIQEIKQVVS